MSIRDISRAQAAYQEDWRDLYRRPLGLINETNTAANNWRGVQQNLDTQHWRTQGINADNELRTVNDALKKQQMDGLRQFMDFQKRNSYDKNGQPVPFNEQVNTMRNDPNANGFAFQNLLATSPAARINAQAKSYQNAQTNNNKWANGFIDTLMGMQQKDELGNPTGQIDKAQAEQYAKLYGLANPSQQPFINNVMQGLNAPPPQAVAPQQPQSQYVQPQVTQPVAGQLQNGVTTVPNGWQQGYMQAANQQSNINQHGEPTITTPQQARKNGGLTPEQYFAKLYPQEDERMRLLKNKDYSGLGMRYLIDSYNGDI